MCGITSSVGFTRGLTAESAVVQAMTETLVNRGPNAAGVWADFHVALDHRWLAIIGPEHGARPMLIPERGTGRLPRAVIKVPDGIDLRVAGAVLVQGMTAHYLVNDSYPAQPGDTVLVHAAVGGAGLLLTQMLKQRTVYVIGAASTSDKQRIALDDGADEVIRHDEVTDLAAEVRRRTGGQGVHAVPGGHAASGLQAW